MKRYLITIIIIYFGRWPDWHQLFLDSCKRNEKCNFLIFTDHEFESEDHSNLTFYKFTLAGFNSLASLKLNLRIGIDDPYKICDLRPAFGVIFSDYLRASTFWGYTDVDLIFGNINFYINENVLFNYDVITTRKEYLVGHFTLYRNIKDINFLYMHCDYHQQIFMSKAYYGFDECNFQWWSLIAGQDILKTSSPNQSMTYIVKRLAMEKKIRAYFFPLVLEQTHSSDTFNKVLIWKNGILNDKNNGEEYMYFHFHYLKKSVDFFCPLLEKAPDEYTISKRGFQLII